MIAAWLTVALGAEIQSDVSEGAKLPVTRPYSVEWGRYAERSDAGRYPPVAVALGGGGQRAGNLSLGVLAGLDYLGLTERIDYLSTVSGGGLAAAWMVRHFLEAGEEGLAIEERPFYSEVRALIKKEEGEDQGDVARRGRRQGSPAGALDKNIGFRFMVGGWFWLIPSSKLDRDDQLERVLDRFVLGREDEKESLWEDDEKECWDQKPCRTRDERVWSLEDVFLSSAKEKGAVTPYWVANGTTVNGEIFPFTPDVLEKAGVCSYHHRLHPYIVREASSSSKTGRDKDRKERVDPPAIPNFVQRLRIRDVDSVTDMALAVGLSASSAAYVITPGTLGTFCEPRGSYQYLHVMDGGLGDNLGVSTAISALSHEFKETQQPGVLLIVDAGVSAESLSPNLKFSPDPPAFSWVFRRLLDEVNAKSVASLDYLLGEENSEGYRGLYRKPLPFPDERGRPDHQRVGSFQAVDLSFRVLIHPRAQRHLVDRFGKKALPCIWLLSELHERGAIPTNLSPAKYDQRHLVSMGLAITWLQQEALRESITGEKGAWVEGPTLFLDGELRRECVLPAQGAGSTSPAITGTSP